MCISRVLLVGCVTVLAPAALSEPRSACAQATEDAKPTVVEHVTKKPVRRGGGLGTVFYAPSEQEQPHFKRLAKDEISTGGLAGDYDITKKDQTFVGWFGIVRELKEDKPQDQTTLIVEHKYFDGLSDAHIMALSFNGSGDFEATLPGVGHKIECLTLVKVYGTATVPGGDSPTTIKAEFIRNWHWGTFTFLMAAGTQRGSDEWRKLNKIDLDDIYDPYPDDVYYEQRLGKR